MLLPLDMATSSSVVNGTSTNGIIVESLWRVNYWVTFLWCWVVCPIVMEYWASGDFEPKHKLRTAFRNNFKFYAYATVIMIITGVLVALSKRFWPSQVSDIMKNWRISVKKLLGEYQCRQFLWNVRGLSVVLGTRVFWGSF